MNYKRNEKILQLTDETLIVGVDIAKEKHVARAQDNQEFNSEKRSTLRIVFLFTFPSNKNGVK
ncbi:hypothetical protein J32TS6_17530 [Virgibacillus pantothenticus]|nr:hypothetical protein [Virgibacillus pantothenticus]MBS7428049.1 hypothetical protein [Virgibacillus sp. 19R1-5]MBU8567781.1 IS110 family transposase [Virgibacillus pantothenticus]MBU8601574.1 IS110 family transposase [Virgibacillus pantothenticus]MBU8635803.1 IS110 family transposase [Virgibacillus pantothenticus]MBU8643509.1 IS110 family transposase [Virgibacillus pantothenticus]